MSFFVSSFSKTFRSKFVFRTVAKIQFSLYFCIGISRFFEGAFHYDVIEAEDGGALFGNNV